jgi:hypothetical protein
VSTEVFVSIIMVKQVQTKVTWRNARRWDRVMSAGWILAASASAMARPVYTTLEATLAWSMPGCVVGVPQAATSEPTPPTPPAPPVRARFTNADELLAALETADRGMTKLSAEVTRVKDAMLTGSRQIWRGRLFYLIDPPMTPEGALRRRFAVHFDSLQADDRLEERPQQYLFDGRMLIERLAEEKLQTEREIVGPGETFDPMRVGEGPLPIPVGQRKADILERYDAELSPMLEGLNADEPSLIEHVQETYQLRLTPKPEFADEDDFREIRLWYKADSLLPVLARTLNQAEDVETVQLIDAQRNDESRVEMSAFETRAPEGWTVQRVEWRGRTRPGAERVPEDAAGAEGERVEFRAEFPGPKVKPAPETGLPEPSAPNPPAEPK